MDTSEQWLWVMVVLNPIKASSYNELFGLVQSKVHPDSNENTLYAMH